MNKKLLLLLLLFVFVNPVFSQILQRGTESTAIKNIDNNGVGNAFIDINKPAGVQVDDIMLVTIAQQDNSNQTATTFNGGSWISIVNNDIEGGGAHAWGTVMYKIVTIADLSTTNYSFQIGTGAKHVVGTIVAFSGVDISNPIDAVGTLTRNGNDKDASTDAITTVTPNAAILLFAMSKKNLTFSNWQTTTPGSLNQVFNNQGSGNSAVGMAWGIKPTIGSTGGGSARLSEDNNKTAAILLALRSACPKPAAAGSISGTAAVCQSQSAVGYSVANIDKATSYTWAYSGLGATIINGTTRTPTITFAANATSGNLTVYGVNGCGNGTISTNYVITVNEIPKPTGIITPVTCSNGSDGAIMISGLNTPVEFNKADNDNINLGSSFLSSRNRFTVEGWIKFNLADVGARMSLFGQNDVIEFFLDNNMIQLWTANGGSVSMPLTAAIGNNSWHHIAATGNGTNLRIYIDGTLSATGGSATTNYGTSTSNVQIGSGVPDPLTTVGRGFTGQIKKVGFYNAALSLATIANLASSPIVYLGTEPGLIAGYNFFESTGITLNSLPAGRNGSFGNSPQWIYTFNWKKTGTATFAVSSKDISGLSSGEYNLTITTLGISCPVTESFTVGFTNAAPSIPQVEISHPTCIVSTGSVVLNNLPATETWTLYQDGISIGTGTGDTKTVENLAPGTYEFTVGVASCLSLGSDLVVIKPVPLIAKYNGSWTNGPPTIEQSIVFSGNYTSIGNLEGCDCTVNSGVQVTVQSGHTLKITNAVKVNTASGTSLTLQNTASLVQVNDDAVNTGVISYIRSNSTTRETDYTYWSSPVAGQILSAVSPATPAGFFYSFNAVEDNWNYAPPSTVMGKGIGYIIRGPKIVGIPGPNFHEATFKGTPNNGKIELPGIIIDKSYLLGNPYPSALNANRFINDNSAVLDGTLYFWTHMTPIGDAVFNPGSGVYAYSSNDYATYNLTGGLATNPGSAASQSVSAKPTGEIAAGQAFFTSSRLDPTNNTIVFNNRMRLDVNDAIMDNSQFFKVKNSTNKTNTIEKHRVWLNLTNTQGAFKQMLVGYITGATNDYDSSFDGPSYNGNEFIDFYSISDGEFLAIQGRTLPFDENDFVALGYSSVMEGDFSISIDEVDGLLVSQNIYLEDKLNNSIHNLTKEAYTFTTAIGTFDDRFVLRYTDKTLGVADLDQLKDRVIISKDKNELKIKSATETIKRVTIFDLLGKKVFDKEALDETEFRSSNVSLFKQMGIVEVTLANGQVISKKVAF